MHVAVAPWPLLTQRSGAQPDHDKSLGQEATDKVGRSHDRTAHGSSGGSILDKGKHALGLDKH